MELTRRALIVRGGMASGALALGGASAVATSPKAHKAKIVVTGGHPGDPEYGCGGTIATLTEEGHEVVLLYLNDGAWPPIPSETRLAEAKRACELLGA
jgi:N-acetylglucosamine malate deacetylase 1